MNERNKEKLYKLITIVCVVLCLLLIGRVAADELTDVKKAAPPYEPPAIRPASSVQTAARETQTVLDEETIAEKLGGYLTQALPLRDVAVSIRESGRVTVSAVCPRQRLLRFLKSGGDRVEGLGLLERLLPGQIALSLTADCTCDEDSRLIAAAPAEAAVGDVTIAFGELPQSLFDHVTRGLNKLLLDEGEAFSQIFFTDGAIILKP